MDVKNIVMAVVGMVLAAIMIGGALLPSVASALVVSGDSIEITNAQQNGYPHRYSEVDELELVITVTSDDFEIILNDKVIEKTSGTQPMVFSNSMYVELSRDSNSNITLFFTLDDLSNSLTITQNTIGVTTCVFNDGVWTLSPYDGEEISGTYDWVITFDEMGEYIAHIGSSLVYCNSFKKDIVLCGSYNTGELDTGYYCYKDGILVSNLGYSSELSYDMALANGTTDIYEVSNIECTFSDGTTSESFQPYRYLVKESVDGHADSGPAYALIGVLPIVAIAGLVMAGIYFFISRK